MFKPCYAKWYSILFHTPESLVSCNLSHLAWYNHVADRNGPSGVSGRRIAAEKSYLKSPRPIRNLLLSIPYSVLRTYEIMFPDGTVACEALRLWLQFGIPVCGFGFDQHEAMSIARAWYPQPSAKITVGVDGSTVVGVYAYSISPEGNGSIFSAPQ